VLKNSDCEKYPLVAPGQWDLKRVCIDVLDFGLSPMLFLLPSVQKMEELFAPKRLSSSFSYHMRFCYKFLMLQDPGNTN
jgi:hypothetical protein